jgi:hypothetical protein
MVIDLKISNDDSYKPSQLDYALLFLYELILPLFIQL